MSSLHYERSTVAVLWWRDLLLFAQQKSRVVGAVATMLLLWLVIGAGIAPNFAVPDARVGYMEYFYPGVIFMLMLQVSISATMSVIEDRSQGFLQGVLVAPGSRTSLVLGKTAGSATVALLHAALFLTLAPLAGFPYGKVAWLGLLVVLSLVGLALTATGFTLAWLLDSVQGYHVVMNLVLFPLWILSGAMFPAEGLHPALATIVRLNPMSYAMAALRRALYGGDPPPGLVSSGSLPAVEWVVLGSTTVILILAACWIAQRKPTNV